MLTRACIMTTTERVAVCNRMLKVLLHGTARTTVHTVCLADRRGSHLLPANWPNVPWAEPENLAGASFSLPGSRMTPMT